MRQEIRLCSVCGLDNILYRHNHQYEVHPHHRSCILARRSDTIGDSQALLERVISSGEFQIRAAPFEQWRLQERRISHAAMDRRQQHGDGDAGSDGVNGGAIAAKTGIENEGDGDGNPVSVARLQIEANADDGGDGDGDGLENDTTMDDTIGSGDGDAHGDGDGEDDAKLP